MNVGRYRPLLAALAVAGGTILTMAAAAGILERIVRDVPSLAQFAKDGTLLAGSLISLTFLLVALGTYALYLRRGRHSWNVASLEIVVRYLQDDGSKVSVQRTQTIYPNRPGLRSARIGVSSGPEHGRADPGAPWTVKAIPGTSWFGERPQETRPETSTFREARGYWLYVHTATGFPYPKYAGLLQPRSAPQKFYGLQISGESIYSGSYLDDEEYLQIKVEDAEIEKVSVKLDLPAKWSDEEPSVNLHRVHVNGVDSYVVPKEINGEEEQPTDHRRRYCFSVFRCSHETLRLDWRRRSAIS